MEETHSKPRWRTERLNPESRVTRGARMTLVMTLLATDIMSGASEEDAEEGPRCCLT